MFMRDNQRKFQRIKDNQIRAKSLFATLSDLNVTNLKGSYEMRVKDKKDYANHTQQISKKLEIEEAQLLNRLQKTYQTEQKMESILKNVSDSSPFVKKVQAQKKESKEQ